MMGSIVDTIVGAVTSVFGKTIGDPLNLAGKPAPSPNIPPPTVMPLPDDAAVQEAKKKQIATQAATSGRASTILTSDNQNQKLGG